MNLAHCYLSKDTDTPGLRGWWKRRKAKSYCGYRLLNDKVYKRLKTEKDFEGFEKCAICLAIIKAEDIRRAARKQLFWD